MQVRGRVDYGANDVRAALPGEIQMSQLQYVANSTAGASTLTAASLLAGVINRTGPGGAYADTLPTVNQLVAACPQLSEGDSFTFILRNTVAFANTITTNTGWTLGSNTAIAASLVREFLVTMTAIKPTVVVSATTTNASAVLTNLSDDAVKALAPGMLVTGTGIPAATTLIAVNANSRTATMSAAATATGNNIAVTANPTATLEGVRSSTL